MDYDIKLSSADMKKLRGELVQFLKDWKIHETATGHNVRNLGSGGCTFIGGAINFYYSTDSGDISVLPRTSHSHYCHSGAEGFSTTTLALMEHELWRIFVYYYFGGTRDE